MRICAKGGVLLLGLAGSTTLMGCASGTAQNTYVINEFRATDRVPLPAGQGKSINVPRRCVDVTSPSHIGQVHRYGAGCPYHR